ncbi:hypothetical protein EWB00_000523 [Schistosoma japonicum]|uniref:Uncharacterized protein n=1 Tax=Schistosoma japonicum TaxID=6182 RepID=A0A4Z2CKE4_SCHJA|nr:hypothetical protein EWB00_000523 [Schistosoma japonicum]
MAADLASIPRIKVKACGGVMSLTATPSFRKTTQGEDQHLDTQQNLWSSDSIFIEPEPKVDTTINTNRVVPSPVSQISPTNLQPPALQRHFLTTTKSGGKQK